MLAQFPGAGAMTQATIQHAAEYIRGKLREFRELEPKLLTMQHQAAVLEGRAREVGDDGAADAARARRLELRALYDEYGRVLNRVDLIVSRVPGLGAIVVPLAVAATVVALAAAMASIFRSVAVEARELELIAEGVLTPKEAERLKREREGGLFGGVADAAKYAALAVGLYFGLPMIARLLRG